MQSEPPIVAVTGAAGFIGRNLVVRLQELGCDVRRITRASTRQDIQAALSCAEVVFHLAGAVRPPDPLEFLRTVAFANDVAAAIARGGRRPLVVYSSSRKATLDTSFGRSARACEEALLRLGERGEATVAVYRLPNVFGKWARPNYNSCVATFCHNLARGLPIRIDDEAAPLSLLYVDDLIEQWRALMDQPPTESGYLEAEQVYPTTVGELAATLSAFAEGRRDGHVENVGSGLQRALYATFVAALPAESFSYPLVAHTDPRGSFAEVLKTRDGGQVSVLTAEPGVTRGGHYHHSKVEKFLVVHGHARFRFRHILDGETFELMTSAERPVVVETIPGWTHDITNVGNGVMVSLLWASEIFDRSRPDTVLSPV
ncbi:MAG: polysaccharide biosynthesis C-terminal domain-containing protein [Phenylobacterium sp.]